MRLYRGGGRRQKGVSSAFFEGSADRACWPTDERPTRPFFPLSSNRRAPPPKRHGTNFFFPRQSKREEPRQRPLTFFFPGSLFVCTFAPTMETAVDWKALVAMADSVAASSGAADCPLGRALVAGLWHDAPFPSRDGHQICTEAARACARFWRAVPVITGQRATALIAPASPFPTPNSVIRRALDDSVVGARLSKTTRQLVAEWRDWCAWMTQIAVSDAMRCIFRLAVSAALAVLSDASRPPPVGMVQEPRDNDNKIDARTECWIVVGSPDESDSVAVSLYTGGRLVKRLFQSRPIWSPLSRVATEHYDVMGDPSGTRSNALDDLFCEVAAITRLGPIGGHLPCGFAWVSDGSPIGAVAVRTNLDLYEPRCENGHVTPPFLASRTNVESLRGTLDLHAFHLVVRRFQFIMPPSPRSSDGLAVWCAWRFGGSLADALRSGSAPRDVLTVVARHSVMRLHAAIVSAPLGADVCPPRQEIEAVADLLDVPFHPQITVRTLVVRLLRIVAISFVPTTGPYCS